MPPSPPEPPYAPKAPAKARVSFKPVMITLLCAAFIALGSCAGALSAAVGGSVWRGLADPLTIVFSLAAGTFLVSIVWLIVVVIVNAFRS